MMANSDTTHTDYQLSNSHSSRPSHVRILTCVVSPSSLIWLCQSEHSRRTQQVDRWEAILNVFVFPILGKRYAPGWQQTRILCVWTLNCVLHNSYVNDLVWISHSRPTTSWATFGWWTDHNCWLHSVDPPHRSQLHHLLTITVRQSFSTTEILTNS